MTEGMQRRIDELLQMAEWFKAHGQMELYRSAKETATKLCDYILFIETYQPNSEARRSAEIASPEKRSGVQRGALEATTQT